MGIETGAFPSSRQARWTLTVLILAYIFSFVDRTILTLMVDPIRRSLKISDVQFSLLHGFAFAIFYTLLGVPIARLADRRNRVRIITIGVMLWSVMTALCGLARSFGHLFLARVGVGVGEAALSPAAYSVLADTYPPHKLTQALSLYTAAAYFGGGLALIVGGSLVTLVPVTVLPLIGRVEPWQMVFLLVGLPGLLIGLLMLTVREPTRIGPVALEGESVRAVVAHIGGRRGAYGLLIAAVIAHSMMWNGTIAWMPSVLIRGFGLSPAVAGPWAGVALAFAGTSGIICGGMVSAWLRRRGRTDANHLILIVASVMAVPFGCTMTMVASPRLAIALYVLFLFFTSAPYGGIVAALQEISPNRMRAQISALYQLALNLAGIGCGPTIVALMGERMFGGDLGIRPAIVVIVAVMAPIAGLCAWMGRRPHGRALIAMGENKH